MNRTILVKVLKLLKHERLTLLLDASAGKLVVGELPYSSLVPSVSCLRKLKLVSNLLL